jgi:beta-glucosidase
MSQQRDIPVVPATRLWSKDLTRRRFLGGLTLGAGAVAASQLPFQGRAAAADVPVYLDPTAPLDDRVHAILALMTDSQKLNCFTGVPATTLLDGFQLPSTTSGGVEGLHGSGQSASATMFPQAIGFGSTWDVELVESMGHVVGFETRSKNANSLRVWAPVADTRSNPLAGRFEEGYGEDPFLCGTLGTAYAFGIKGRDPFYILAKPELKHFFGYDHEWNRARSSSSMGCRALHEFNIVGYKMPIVAGAVLGAMTAYNLINGVPSNVNPIMQIARQDWAPGNFMFVPDAWDEFNLYNTKGAPYVYPLVRPANADISYAAGLSPNPVDDATNRQTTAALLLRAGMTNFADGNGAGFNGASAAQGAMQAGILGVSMTEADRVVRDWLAYKIRTGALDGNVNPYNATVIPPNSNPQNLQSSRDLALLAAQEQIVLLKNDHNLLPLDAANLSTLALIGPLGDVNLRDYYSPKPADSARITPLQGIGARIGVDKVDFFNGTDTVAWESVAFGTFATAATGTAQMTAGYSAATTPIDGGYPLGDGRHVTASQAFQVYDWGYDQNFFRSVATGNYVNTNQAIVNNATQLRASQATMIDSNAAWNTNANFHYLRNEDGTRSIYGVDYIEDDQFYRRFTTGRYAQAGPGADHSLAPTLNYADFQSGGPDVQALAKFREYLLEAGASRAAAVAAAADYAVVVIGNNVLVNARESQDRPGLALSPQQRALVHAAAAARPGKTVVVIVSSYPFAIKEIQDDPNVAAILYSSHAGQSAGTALASVLFGDYAPAGRLSATWLADESSLPKMGPDADGHDPQYSVDMLEYDQLAAKLTYRYSEAEHVYPFGHGLSYTSFAYRDLSVPPIADAAQPFAVTFSVINTGAVPADEVVQVYLHARNSAYGDNVANKQLVGFQRVKTIAAGETRRVTIQVDPQDMFVWDAVTQSTIVETGSYDLVVGASSQDIRLSSTILIKGAAIGDLDLTTARNAWECYTISSGVSHWEVSKANTLARNGGYYSVTSRRDGDYIGFTKTTLNGINAIELRVATTTADWADVSRPAIDVRIDDPAGPLVGTGTFAATGGLHDFITTRAALHNLPGTRGTHNLYLIFRAGGIYLDTLRLLHQLPR